MALGETHPDYATDLNNLAGLYESQGRYAEAEPLYQQALTIMLNALGAEHPNTQTVWQNYLLFLLQAEMFEKAESLAPGIMEAYRAQSQETPPNL